MATARGAARSQQMTKRITGSQPASSIRVAVLAAFATAFLVGMLATPAYADNDHDNGNGHGNRNRHWNQPQPVQHRYYDGYYRQPDVYYSAPPVVYQPYYPQPAPFLNLNFR
jgi:hypothetical protein